MATAAAAAAGSPSTSDSSELALIDPSQTTPTTGQNYHQHGQFAPTDNNNNNNNNNNNDDDAEQSMASNDNDDATVNDADNADNAELDGDEKQKQQIAQHENLLLESAYARNKLSRYIFHEFYHKNFTSNLNSSEPVELVPLGVGSSGGAGGPGGGGGGAAGAASSATLNDSVLFVASPSSSSAAAAAAAHASGAAGLGGVTASVHNHAAAAAANSSLLAAVAGLNGSAAAAAAGSRPYFGDAFYSFQLVYWPIHCVICLAICTLGIFANVTNIIVLTRPNMITAVNTILSAMAFSDLIVNISNIPYLMHELSDSTNITSFYSFPWACYILFHAHTTVTAHTISIWLTCVLATWRYFVVCRSQSSNQRNWSVGLAKRAIVGVFLFVPIFCIPNYLSFAIVREVTESNSTIYKVGFSHLADESDFIKTFHFWIFSCLTKLVPCVLLTFFTTVLIRKLLKTRERRLRLATTYGVRNREPGGEHELGKMSIPNGDTPAGGQHQRRRTTRGSTGEICALINGAGSRPSLGDFSNFADEPTPSRRRKQIVMMAAAAAAAAKQQQQQQAAAATTDTNSSAGSPARTSQPDLTSAMSKLSDSGGAGAAEQQPQSSYKIVQGNDLVQLAPISGSGCTSDAEIIATSCNSSSGSSGAGRGRGEFDQQNYLNGGCANNQTRTRIMSQLIVESNESSRSNHGATISLTTAPTKMLASCDTDKSVHHQQQQWNSNGNEAATQARGQYYHQQQHHVQDDQLQQRPASTCGPIRAAGAANACYRGNGNDFDSHGADRDNDDTASISALVVAAANNNNNNNDDDDALMNNDNQHLFHAEANAPGPSEQQHRKQHHSRVVSLSQVDLPSSTNGGASPMATNNKRRGLGAPPTATATNTTTTNTNTTTTGLNHSNDRFSEKRSSETILGTGDNNAAGGRGRSTGSTTLGPFQMVKLQAAQRQLNQNETTTRLLIAVMIVFLICEFPAGILAALCAILGQDFFENVYQPTGTLTDLLALINSSVNFVLYCFMSTQFRITFYRVVLHCPAPIVPHHDQLEAKEARKQSARKLAQQ